MRCSSKALQRIGYYALAKIAMHNREHIIILRPGAKGILLAHDVLPGRDPAGGRVPHRYQSGEGQRTGHGEDADLFAEADFEPEKYHDTYRDNLQQMIEAKIEGKQMVETPTEHIAR